MAPTPPAPPVPGMARGPVGPGVPAKGMTAFAMLSIIAALCFGALITLQIIEYKYYESGGPDSRSVWPATMME